MLFYLSSPPLPMPRDDSQSTEEKDTERTRTEPNSSGGPKDESDVNQGKNMKDEDDAENVGREDHHPQKGAAHAVHEEMHV